MDNLEKILFAVKKGFIGFKSEFDICKKSQDLFINMLNIIKTQLGDCEFEFDYLCGEQTKEIDGFTQDYFLKPNDTIIIDLRVKYQQTWCDITRTFFVGEPNDEQKQNYQMLLMALNNAQGVLKNNAIASEIYDSANQSFIKNDKTLLHHAGHRIGEFSMVQPQFLSERKETIKSGDIVALEVGDYTSCGMRIENDYRITENGCENLFDFPLNIEYFIIK